MADKIKDGRYANIRVNQTKGTVSLVIEFEMNRDRELLALLGNRLPDAEQPIFLNVERATPENA